MNITPESYVFKFGKYNKMKAIDVAKITEVDKDDNDVPKGLMYLKFLVEKCDWFRHKEIIEQVIKITEEGNKKEEQSKPKKEKKEKKHATVKITTNETLDMNEQ